jgi:hypothetical protein
MARREFSAKVALEIIRRAADAKGSPRCERCGGVAVGGEVHHVLMDAMQVDKSAKLTAADGELLCKPCHKEETARQAPALAKAKRLERRAAGVRTAPAVALQSAPMPISERTAAKLARGPKADVLGETNIMRRFK